MIFTGKVKINIVRYKMEEKPPAHRTFECYPVLITDSDSEKANIAKYAVIVYCTFSPNFKSWVL